MFLYRFWTIETSVLFKLLKMCYNNNWEWRLRSKILELQSILTRPYCFCLWKPYKAAKLNRLLLKKIHLTKNIINKWTSRFINVYIFREKSDVIPCVSPVKHSLISRFQMADKSWEVKQRIIRKIADMNILVQCYRKPRVWVANYQFFKYEKYLSRW